MSNMSKLCAKCLFCIKVLNGSIVLVPHDSFNLIPKVMLQLKMHVPW